MRFASLGSGSEGNALVVDGRGGRVMIDCGFGLREAERRLALHGIDPASIDALLVTHEHGDHVGGVWRFASAHRLEVRITHGTLRAAPPPPRIEGVDVVPIDPHEPFEVAGLRIEPIAVPHDACEPVQFVVDDGRSRLGVLTDLGHASAHVVRSLSRLDALVLECNHDVRMLADGDYPPALKRRVGGDWGHLSNDAAGALLAAIDRGRLSRVVAAHLSRSNNRPELALAALAAAWPEGASAGLLVADQALGLGWVDCREPLTLPVPG